MNLLKTILILVVLTTLSYSHAILLMVEKENDSTLYIEGGLSTGRVPAGASIVLNAKATGRPLFEGALPESGNILVPMPTQPYTVTLNLSEGHSETKSGPLHKKEASTTKNTVVPAEKKTTKEEVKTDETATKETDAPQKGNYLTWIMLGVAILIGFLMGFKGKK